MNETYETMTAAQIQALLDNAPFGTLAVTDGDAAWAMPMFYRVARRQGLFLFTMKTADTGTKIEMLEQNPNAVFTITARRGGRYESVIAQGTVRVRPASCGCRGKVELELTAAVLSGRSYEDRPAAPEAANRPYRAPEYEPPRPVRREAPFRPMEEPAPTGYEEEPRHSEASRPAPAAPYDRPEKKPAAERAFREPKAEPRTAQPSFRQEEKQRVRRCESGERLDRLWHRYGEKDPECTALKLAQSTPEQVDAGAVLKNFERVRESDVAAWREKTGHIVFRKDGIYRLRVRAQATDMDTAQCPKLALWCENGSGCLVEQLAFRPVTEDEAELEATLVFEVDDSHYSYTLKNVKQESWQLTGIFLFEKIR